MYRKLDLDLLVPNPKRTSRISRMFAKKLRHNIERIGMYEILTVRPHPRLKGKFQVLNGHARLEALRALGIPAARCDVWTVTDSQAELFLAILNRLRGSDGPELRMNLLLKLLRNHSKEELAAHIPETVTYLAKLQALAEQKQRRQRRKPQQKSGIIIVDFYLDPRKYGVVSAALDHIIRRFNLADSSQALTRMADLYLTQSEKPAKTGGRRCA